MSRPARYTCSTMKKKPIHFAVLLLCLAGPLRLPAQEAEGGDDGPPAVEEVEDVPRFWQASLPGGHYMVALDRIASISMHEYVLDAQLIVTEMTVDTNGRGLARFYHTRTVAEAAAAASGTASRVIERGHDLLDRAGQRTGVDIHNMVQKNYPSTSHAGTIEYRIEKLKDLKALYGSLRRAWESGKGRRVTLK